MDEPAFQLPAAASIFLFFSILLAVSGAFSYFLESWSIPFLVVLFFILNILYRYEIIDPTNKAYGLNYTNRTDRPVYDRDHLLAMCSTDKVAADKAKHVTDPGKLEEKTKRRKTIAADHQYQRRRKPECCVYHECAAETGSSRTVAV